MSRRYFFFGETQAGVGWEKHAWKVHQEGVNREGAEKTPTEVQRAGGGERVRHLDAAIGLDSQDCHMGGDRVVTVAEIPDPATGDITQYVERYSDSGRFMGSYAIPWQKWGDGNHVSGKPRRIFY